jgi:hypothetical protein
LNDRLSSYETLIPRFPPLPSGEGWGEGVWSYNLKEIYQFFKKHTVSSKVEQIFKIFTN